MNYTLPVTVMSLAFLCAFFHSCHGMICYMCASMNYDNPRCDNITDDEYLFDYGSRADYCITVLVDKDKPDKIADGQYEIITRTIRRSGFSDKSYPAFERQINMYKDRGYKVDIDYCHEDRCNYK